MIVNNNIEARASLVALSRTQAGLSKAIGRLSTGLRINTASDDAAGLAVSEKMRSQIRGYAMAKRNAQDAISLIQTAEGALSETHNILQRLRELAVQASSDTLTDADRTKLQNEADELVAEINRIANETQFNTKKLFDGSVQNNVAASATVDGTVVTAAAAQGDVLFSGNYTVRVFSQNGTSTMDTIQLLDETNNVVREVSYNGNATNIEFDNMQFTVAAGINTETSALQTVNAGKQTAGNDNSLIFQVGANSGQTMSTSIGKMDAASLGLQNFDADGNGAGNFSIKSQSDAQLWLKVVDRAVSKVSEQRAVLGAKQNRLESTITSLQIAEQNIQAAESRIRDADMAQEMMEFTRLQILQQTGTAMLASANTAPQSVLSLF